LITAPGPLRRARSESAVDEREKRLIPDSEKAKRADYTYVNTGSIHDLDEFVGSVVDDLTG
jgi:hypothetical protein